jgi:penicillin G amidase
MKLIPAIISTFITLVLIFVLNRNWGPVPAMGKFLSPQEGFWQNAVSSKSDYNADLKLPGLKGRVSVYLDERLVPHVFAENDQDLYFVQGYLHAKFRLWQMEFQTFAAAGRLSEFLGNDPRLVHFDRETRRSGMVYGAERALSEIESNPISKAVCDAYTAGANAYIDNLTDGQLPFEYKLLGYKPERWNNLKTALFLKQMSRVLAGSVDALTLTNENKYFPYSEFKILYPQIPDSLLPIVPRGTSFPVPASRPVIPTTADSLYFGNKNTVTVAESIKQNPNNGSNNWAVAGSKTASGFPILCNDPHLDLSLPAIWYEMQLNSPGVNAYGATFPGSPSVIIGFNDDIAWGVTNSQQDVKNYFEIRYKDDSRKEYWFNGEWKKIDSMRIEEIKVKGGQTIYDTVAYTFFGPVMFDSSFENNNLGKRAIVCRWMAHDASNEGLTFYKLNRAKNYDEYLEAIKTFSVPAQNFVYADKSGEIALWQQGKFPRRWEGQGLMVMPATDTSYFWQGFIPQEENPHVVNPISGYVESANQRPVDSSYPYFIPGKYITARGISIAKHLDTMNHITIDDMKRLQNNYFNVTAKNARTILLKYVREEDLSASGKKYLDIIRNWDLNADANSVGQTIYQTWWDSLSAEVWNDELAKVKPEVMIPGQQTLLEALLRDSAFSYIDNINTPQKETIHDVVTSAMKKATVTLDDEEKKGKLSWAKHRPLRIYHLLRTALTPFSRAIDVGGSGNIINATAASADVPGGAHGPSWRMIVELSQNTVAYGVYPGGQEGNPGSRYYDNFIDTWAKGNYYSLWFMKRSETTDKRVTWTMNFLPK